MANIHATCVEVMEHGILLLGEPGSGKSDLALRLIDPECGSRQMCNGRLVADDRVILENVDGRLSATAPEKLRGRLEVRGVGVVSVPYATRVAVILVVHLNADKTVDRTPDFERQVVDISGVRLPYLDINPFEASAPAKIRAMVRALTSQTFANHIHMPEES